MSLDYGSLLVALGFSGGGLILALLGSWLLARSERFLLTWSTGVMLIVVGTGCFTSYTQSPDLLMAGTSMALIMLAFAVLYGGARQFVRRVSPLPAIMLVGPPAILAVSLPLVFGLDGVAFFFENAVAAIILLLTAAEYWRGRHEARVPILGIVVLYIASAASFILCAVAIAINGKPILDGPPSGWVEDLNLVVCIVGMTGVGALSLALNQTRLAARHRREAMTDALTGLPNRRALFEACGARLPAGTVVVVFDLDRFKAINDRHGHAVGDAVLSRFGAMLHAHRRAGDIVARLGGEEFALVLPDTPIDRAAQIAELIRRRFAAEQFGAASGEVGCTVSAGLAIAKPGGEHFEATLAAADRALYSAKADGRDRIVSATLRAV